MLESGSGSEILLGLDLGGRRRTDPAGGHRLARDGGIIPIWGFMSHQSRKSAGGLLGTAVGLRGHFGRFAIYDVWILHQSIHQVPFR